MGELRESKKRETRQRLFDVATDMFHETTVFDYFARMTARWLLAGLVACSAPPTTQAAPPPTAPVASAPPPTVVVEQSVDYIFQNVPFTANSAVLGAGSESTIDEIATALRDDPAALSVVAVVGHAAKNERAPASLADDRASAVVAALRARGVAAERVPALGFAAYCPLEAEDTAEAAAKNRRVEFRVLRTKDGDTNADVGCDDARRVPPARRAARAGQAQVADTSDWRGAAADAELALTWTVDLRKARPPIQGDEQDRTKVDVPFELTLTVDGRAHTLSVQGNAGSIGAARCGRLVSFWAGLTMRFDLERLADGRVLLSRTVGGEASADVTKPLWVFAAPQRAHVAQTVVTITPDGARSTERCLSATR